MRQNLIIILLSVVVTLLAVSVLKSPSPAAGQMAGGTATSGMEVVGATGSLMSGSGAAFYLYDNSKQKLAVYFLGNNGLELRAVRDISWDLQALEYNARAGMMTTVDAIKKAVIKQQAKSKRSDK